MKTILTSLCFIFLYKLVEDNIPNLHYKNLIKYFHEFHLGLVILSLVLYYTINNKEAQKDIQLIIGILLIAVIVSEIINKEKKKINKIIKN